MAYVVRCPGSLHLENGAVTSCRTVHRVDPRARPFEFWGYGDRKRCAVCGCSFESSPPIVGERFGYAECGQPWVR